MILYKRINGHFVKIPEKEVHTLNIYVDGVRYSTSTELGYGESEGALRVAGIILSHHLENIDDSVLHLFHQKMIMPIAAYASFTLCRSEIEQWCNALVPNGRATRMEQGSVPVSLRAIQEHNNVQKEHHADS